MQIFDSEKHANSSINDLAAALPADYRLEFETFLKCMPDMSPYDLLGLSQEDPRKSNIGIMAQQSAIDLSEHINNHFTKSNRNKLKPEDLGLGVYPNSTLSRKALADVLNQAVETLKDAELRKRYDRDVGVDLARSPDTLDPYEVLGIDRDIVENLGSAREAAIENSKIRRMMQLQLASELALAEAIALELPDTQQQELYLQGARRQISDTEHAKAEERVNRAAAQLKGGAYITEDRVADWLDSVGEFEAGEVWEHFKLAGSKFVEGARHLADGVQLGVERTIPKVEKALDRLLDRIDREITERF